MSDESYGACVVLIPDYANLPDYLVAMDDGGPHVTLTYLGDDILSDDHAIQILDILIQLTNRSDFSVPIEGFDYFGENGEAFVATINPDSAVSDIREEILSALPKELLEIFVAAETFPDFKPHMTLGYVGDDKFGDSSGVPSDISFKGLALWNGDIRTEIEFDLDEGESLAHIGIERKSGRYPWGSGANPEQRNRSTIGYINELRKKGFTDAEIASGQGITTSQLRAAKSIAKAELRAANISTAQRLKEKGLSNVAIGEKMGLNESSVRALLAPAAEDRANILKATSDKLRGSVDEHGYLDIGSGVEQHLGVSETRMKTAIAQLQEEGYSVHYLKVEQLGTGNFTTVKVLAPEGTKTSDIYKNIDKIGTVDYYSEDNGRTFLGLETPQSLTSSRVAVRYSDQGGSDKDGLIEVRRGVDDVALGGANYAQVRIAVDGTHYLKGMAVYSDNLPDGVDVMFNTNKKSTGNKLDAMKAMKDDPDNPFGSVVRQRHYVDANGKKQLSAMNIVNEEGNWHEWSKNLSSQMMSKQSPTLAKEQLKLSFDSKKAEFDEIMALTNPTVKRKLLETFADGADSSADHLKAAGLPRTRNHVILPVTSMKPTEIYAPNYNNGERVVLIRHPHGGKFEIPELVVNNKNSEAKRLLGSAMDAVGIHPKVASRLSGADFDGDTVLVIPNNARKVKTAPPLEGLKNFDPQSAYPKYPGMKPMSEGQKQQKMGDISNLITDMSIRGATNSELARAVRHSMVVIDAAKHELNYKQSMSDNGISELKKKYQGKANAGAKTLISKASSEIRVAERKERSVKDGGKIDPKTGKKMYTETGETYVNKQGKTVAKTTKITKMSNVDNAYALSSGTKMESVYADHANKLKAIANEARKNALSTKPIPYSKEARASFEAPVSTMRAKLNLALKNRPLERKAQLLANTTVSAKRQANPDMTSEDLKKIKGQALTEARARTGASKNNIKLSPLEWSAIQAGAVSPSLLSSILDNADLDNVKALATPRAKLEVSGAKLARAKSMAAAGYTQAEIAGALGVPTSTLNDALNR